MLEPLTTLTRAFDYLGLDADTATVAGVLEAGSQEAPGMRGHRTTPDAAASVGRWRTDFPPDLADDASDALAEVLGQFGYSAR